MATGKASCLTPPCIFYGPRCNRSSSLLPAWVNRTPKAGDQVGAQRTADGKRGGFAAAFDSNREPFLDVEYSSSMRTEGVFLEPFSTGYICGVTSDWSFAT